MRRAIALLPFALVIVIASGCGGGGTETITQVRTQTSAEPLTKAEYIAQSDAICQQYRGRGEDLTSQLKDLGRLDSEESIHKAADLFRQSGHLITTEVQALQALQPPPQDAQVLQSMLSTISSAASHLDDLADAADTLDLNGIKSTQLQATQDNAKARGIATGYGFKVCGQGD